MGTRRVLTDIIPAQKAMGITVLFPLLSILLVAGGVGKWPNLRLPVVDTVAQALSLSVAYSLSWGASGCGRSLAIGLVLVAAGIAACHVTALDSGSSIWSYLDGADFGLWACIALCGLLPSLL